MKRGIILILLILTTVPLSLAEIQDPESKALLEFMDESTLDSEKDGIGFVNDNCQTIYNPNQEDDDNDGVGNACDRCKGIDSDSDGICDNLDEEPKVANYYKVNEIEPKKSLIEKITSAIVNTIASIMPQKILKTISIPIEKEEQENNQPEAIPTATEPQTKPSNKPSTTQTQASNQEKSYPSQPLNLILNVVSHTEIELKWNPPAESKNTIAGYRVYRDNLLIAVVTSITYIDNGLAPETSYIYKISAYDVNGEISPFSSEASATTGKEPKPASSGGSGSGGGSSSPTPEEEHATPSESPSGSPSGSQVSFSPQKNKPTYKNLIGWVVKEIEDLFTRLFIIAAYP